MSIRPLVSFVLFAYNQDEYIRAACEAALEQTYSPLEIIFSDDCSTDRTFEIMQEVASAYEGPHQIRLNRNEKNIGLIAHINLSHELSAGELVVAAAGDDISLPERTEKLASAWLANKGKAFSFHSDVIRIDLAGNDLDRWAPPIAQTPHELPDIALSLSLLIGATHAWTREVFDAFGPIRFPDAYEDLVIAYRSALMGGIFHIPEALVRYRIGSGITTGGRKGKRSRKEQLEHRLKTLGVKQAVLAQRVEDSRTAGCQELALMIEDQLAECRLLLMIYGRRAPFLQVIRLALKQGRGRLCLHAYVRRCRKFSFL